MESQEARSLLFLPCNTSRCSDPSASRDSGQDPTARQHELIFHPRRDISVTLPRTSRFDAHYPYIVSRGTRQIHSCPALRALSASKLFIPGPYSIRPSFMNVLGKKKPRPWNPSPFLAAGLLQYHLRCTKVRSAVSKPRYVFPSSFVCDSLFSARLARSSAGRLPGPFAPVLA
jgi:hypothetical protein